LTELSFAIVGIFMRMQVQETPAFERLKQKLLFAFFPCLLVPMASPSALQGGRKTEDS
jgi:hypothetical protein